MQQVLALALALLAALICAGGAAGRVPTPPDVALALSINGGTVRQNGDLKFIVEVMETFKGGFFPAHRGSGVLLTSKFVLSTKEAAGKPGMLKTRYVLVGRSDGSEGQRVEIKDRILHDGGVLMLLELAAEVAFTTQTRPANLPHQNSDNTGVSAILSGWGKEPTQLKAAAVAVLSCADLGVTGDNLLCSATEGVQACDGDEGDPLVVDLKNGVFKLVGIVTGVQGAKQCTGTIKYIDVAKYTKWILSSVFV